MYQILIDCHDGAKVALSLSLRQSHTKCRRESIRALHASVKKMSCCFRNLSRKEVKDLPPREVLEVLLKCGLGERRPSNHVA